MNIFIQAQRTLIMEQVNDKSYICLLLDMKHINSNLHIYYMIWLMAQFVLLSSMDSRIYLIIHVNLRNANCQLQMVMSIGGRELSLLHWSYLTCQTCFQYFNKYLNMHSFCTIFFIYVFDPLSLFVILSFFLLLFNFVIIPALFSFIKFELCIYPFWRGFDVTIQ